MQEEVLRWKTMQCSLVLVVVGNYVEPILFRNMLLDVPMNKNQRVVLLYSDGTLTWTRKMTRK